MTAQIPHINQRRNRRRLFVSTIVILGLITACVLAFWPQFGMEQYTSYTRPDGRYQVVVMRKKTLFSVMLGQASDSPGVVRLYNQRGELLQETDIEMVQLVESVQWEQKHLSIKLIAEWDLPD